MYFHLITIIFLFSFLNCNSSVFNTEDIRKSLIKSSGGPGSTVRSAFVGFSSSTHSSKSSNSNKNNQECAGEGSSSSSKENKKESDVKSQASVGSSRGRSRDRQKGCDRRRGSSRSSSRRRSSSKVKGKSKGKSKGKKSKSLEKSVSRSSSKVRVQKKDEDKRSSESECSSMSTSSTSSCSSTSSNNNNSHNKDQGKKKNESSEKSKSKKDSKKDKLEVPGTSKKEKGSEKLKTEKLSQISHFKDSCKEIKKSNELLLQKLYEKCFDLFDPKYKSLSYEDLMETLFELWTGFANRSFLSELELPGLLTREDLIKGNHPNLEDLMMLLEECISIIVLIISNLGSYFQKKEKIRELKTDIRVLELE